MQDNIEILGQGKFGCVFMYLNQPTKICKVFFQKDSFNTEIQQISYIKQHVDKNFKYTPIYYDSYTLKVQKDQFSQLFQNCRIQNQQKLYIITLENCGDSLSSMQIHSKQEFFFFLKSFLNILKGLEKFSSKKIIHNDIKPENLVYNQQTFKSKIIDFSILAHLTNKNDKILPNQLHIFFTKLQHIWSLPYHPIEYRILQEAALAINLSPIHIYNMYIDQVKQYNYNNYEFLDYLTNFILNKKQFFDQYQSLKNQIFQFGLYDFHDKIDIYGAGFSLLFVLIKYKNFVTQKQFKLILNFCKQIMNINYQKRLNPTQAIQHYQKLLQQLNFNS